MGTAAPARPAVLKEVRDGVAATNMSEGTGRFTEAERMQLADWDIGAIAMQLGEQDYLLGDQPTCADAAVAAVLISCATEFFNTPLNGLVRKHDNLVAYLDRMTARYFAHVTWPGWPALEQEPA